MIRRWKTVPFRWRPLLFFCIVLYVVLYVPSYFISNKERKFDDLIESNRIHSAGRELLEARRNSIEAEQRRPNPKIIQLKEDKDNEYAFAIDYRGKKLFIEAVLTHPDAESLETKTVLDPKIIKSKKIIATVASTGGFSNANLGGCPDWNCEITSNNIENADIVIMQGKSTLPRKSKQLFVYYSQESPQNSASLGGTGTFFNMTLGFRHDSPAASPYGYTVKLAKQSRISPEVSVADETLVKNKSKVASWFVSHCGTQSRREALVAELQKYLEVDIYGGCGPLKCAKGTSCENSIDTDYHFYMALENSICEDYITEKLWNQGYGHTVIPIVLQRSIIEPYVPPHSFIAFDDYKNIEEMAKHLKFLMDNKKEYLKYFEWRRNYAVIYLDGRKHDALERPWGFCQLCRLAHVLDSVPTAVSNIKLLPNENLAERWDKSCEPVGQLATKLLSQNSSNRNEGPKSNKFPENGKGILVESEMRVKP